MADDSPFSKTVLTGAVRSFMPARELHKKLILVYSKATVLAVITTLVLCMFGLDFTARQYLIVGLASPIATLFFLVPDIWMIGRHSLPIRSVLETIERGERPSEEKVRAALVRALNLPFYSYIRVTFFHGPMAGLSSVGSLIILNWLFDGGYQPWQMVIFLAVAILFASPAHAIIEYFNLAKLLQPIIQGLWNYCGVLDRENQRQLIAVRLKSKLLYLCVFITALPLLFIAFSILFKVDLLLRNLGVHATAAQMQPLWTWTLSIVVVCMVSALAMAVLTSSDVSRSAALLAAGMNEVQRGNLAVNLKITGTDEYADLYRGFNHMIGGLRDEVRMLEISQSLGGELQLDVLISRILRAAAELLDAERSTLFVHDPEKKQLWSRYADGLQTVEIRIADTAGIAGAVFSSGQAENITDPYADPRFNQEVDRRTGYRTTSILCMPIVGKSGRPIGVTQVLNKKGGGVFTGKDEQRLRAFTAQIAVTLENAQLFDEVLAIKNYNDNILASTTNGVITLNNNRAVVTANDAARRILGMDGESIFERAIQDVFTSANPWVVKSVVKVQGTGLNDVVVDTEVLRPDGSKASVNLTTVPLRNAKGERIGFMLNFEDFTSEKRVKSTMARYMSKEVAEQLLEAGEAALGGQLQTVSVMFSDVRGFTTLAEAAGARETVSMLNEYFEQMVEVVFKHRGILDKYIGDAIMALFGSPFVAPDDADRAVATAIDMLLALAELNLRRGAQGQPPLEIGIGIATGDVIVGNIGSHRRMEYTVIGDGVNLASRLEAATKQYGVRVLLSENTVAALKTPIAHREIDLLRVKGKNSAVKVYEALGHYSEASFPALQQCMVLWETGLKHYRQREFLPAAAAFTAILAHHPDDKPSQIYLERCGHYAQSPPSADWNCVWSLKEK